MGKTFIKSPMSGKLVSGKTIQSKESSGGSNEIVTGSIRGSGLFTYFDPTAKDFVVEVIPAGSEISRSTLKNSIIIFERHTLVSSFTGAMRLSSNYYITGNAFLITDNFSFTSSDGSDD